MTVLTATPARTGGRAPPVRLSSPGVSSGAGGHAPEPQEAAARLS